MAQPTSDEVREIIERLKQEVSKESCWTCDCLQRLIAQLELDGPADTAELVEHLKAHRDAIHGCLGCLPCKPGEIFAEYIRRHSS
jgi:hypothetical protein